MNQAALLALYQKLTASIAASGFKGMKSLAFHEIPHLLDIATAANGGIEAGDAVGFGDQPHKEIPLHGLWSVTKWAAWANDELTHAIAMAPEKRSELLFNVYELFHSISSFLIANGIYPRIPVEVIKA